MRTTVSPDTRGWGLKEEELGPARDIEGQREVQERQEQEGEHVDEAVICHSWQNAEMEEAFRKVETTETKKGREKKA